MKPTKEEYKIFSEYLDNIIDWERVYNETKVHSKYMFHKNTIIESIKKLILKYPDSFDESINGRTESLTELFNIRYGIFNEYVYFISNSKIELYGWFLTEHKLFEHIQNNKNKGSYCIIFNYKDNLRKLKIHKIINKNGR